MKPVVLFGAGPIARVAHALLTDEGGREVAACCLDRDYLKGETAFGLPLVPFDEVASRYPPAAFDMFIAVGYSRMNRFREERYRQAKALGYALPSHVSPRASLWPGVPLGDNCLVMDEVVVQPFVEIGSDVILWSAAHIGHESVVGDHCFISSHAVVSGFVTIEPNCFLGTNCTIRDGVTIARETVVGAGAVVLGDTRERGVYAAPRAQLLPLPSDRLPGL